MKIRIDTMRSIFRIATSVSAMLGVFFTAACIRSVNPYDTSGPPAIRSFAASSATLAPGGTLSLSVDTSGSVTGYHYAIVSGGGTLGGDNTASGKTYTAPLSAGTAQIRVTAIGNISAVSRTVSVSIAPITGELDTSFDPGTGADFSILAIAPQPDGGAVIAGNVLNYDTVSRNRIARIRSNGSLDMLFDPGTGADGTIKAVVLQPDGRIVIGGLFNNYKGTGRPRVARINADSSIDLSFTPGTGADNNVLTVAAQPDGKFIITGAFSLYTAVGRSRIARIAADGTLDLSFAPVSGANNDISSIALQADGRVMIGGSFTSYDGTGRSYIARVLSDGTLDASFDPGTGLDSVVNAIAIQPDGKVIIAGVFTIYNGTGRNRIARINTDGSLDTSFDPGTGANAGVNAALLQPDGKIIIGGNFTSYNGTGRNRIARINTDGTLDTTFNPGSGADLVVFSLALQPDGKIIVGGDFTTYNGTGRNKIARIQ